MLTTSAPTPAPNARVVVATTGFAIAANGVNHAYEGQNGWVQALQKFDIAIPQSDITPENFHSVAAIEALVVRTLAQRK